MKKGNALFIILGCCICFLIGIFIGRSTVMNDILVPLENALYTTKPVLTPGFPGNGTVDINTASQEQLMMLPGIGEKLSEKIITYREENGPFRQVQDILLVDGITTSVFADIAIYISVGGNYENSGS